MDPALVKMGLEGVLNLASGMSERNFAKSRFKTREAEIAANKVIREANNKAKAAQGNLLRYRDVLSKQIMAKNYGNLQNTLVTNVLRTQDNNLAVRQYLGIQEAENNGALAASVAASGLGGGTADQLQQVSSVRFATRARQMENNAAVQEESLRNQLSSSHESFVNGQGVNYTDDNLSFLDEVNQEQIPSMGTQLFNAFTKTLVNNSSNIPDLLSKGTGTGGATTSTSGLNKSLFNFDIGSAIIDL